MRIKGQTSIEFLAILGVALLALLVFMMLSQNETLALQQKKTEAEAKNAVSSLAQGAADVYAQGTGARKKVLVALPEGYEYSRSRIGNNAIVVHAAGSDYSEIVDFTVYGSLPKASGKHWIWVESAGNQVKIGFSMVELDKVSISALMPRQNTLMQGLSIKSNWPNQINISVSKTWADEEVMLSFDKTRIALGHLSSDSLGIILETSPNATGFASGSIDLSITDGEANESLSVPVMVEISGNSSIASRLVLAPASFSLSAIEGDSVSGVFQVCTNVALDFVEFNVSNESAGSWMAPLAPLGQMKEDSCQPKTFSMEIPAGTGPGEYSGHVYARGTGAYSPEASLLLSIEVGERQDDGIPPEITRLAVNPERIVHPEPVVVSALVHDGSGVGKCMLRPGNSTSWVAMDAADGSYGQASEQVKYEFFDGLEMGRHTAVVQCTDTYGNSGEASVSFHVMKGMLFVKKGNVETTGEDSWISWVKAHRSMEGESWSMDIVKSSEFISSASDTGYYATLLFAEWHAGMKAQAEAHIARGGQVVLLGNAALSGPQDLGASKGTGEELFASAIDILTNDTYISSPLPKTRVTIADTPTPVCGNSEYLGLAIAGLDNVVLGEGNGIIVWGVQRPGMLNHIGGNLSVRVLDHAVGQSSNAPGGMK